MIRLNAVSGSAIGAGVWVALVALPGLAWQESTATTAPATQPVDEQGYTTMPSGLKYKDIQAGTGPEAAIGDKVTLHHTIQLEDGATLDSTQERGEPVKVRLGIKRSGDVSWDEGAVGMKVGGRRVLLVPPHLAFGTRGSGDQIPPNATLRYELELLEVQPGPRRTATRKEDEKTTASGTRYVELVPGSGTEVVEGSTVKLRAATWRADGTLVNWTADQADPMQLPLKRIGLPGLREAMVGMKAGGKRKVFVPPPNTPATQPAADKDLLEIEIEIVEAKSPPPRPQVPEEQYTRTPSGLRYYDLKPGEGASPEPNSRVSVHYTGWLVDGTVFDSSVESGKPTELPLNQFIQGWIEGVGTMKVGGKRLLLVPPELGYGDQGHPAGIPGGATLLFEIELLEIKP